MTTRTAQLLVLAMVAPMAVSAVWLALTSDHVERPTATALYRSYLTAAPMLIGLYWWRRRPLSSFGPLLIVFGVAAWVVSWQSSDVPLLFNLGVLAEAPAALLTFQLFLAFPTGRLQTVADRLLIGAWAVVLFGFFVPWALGSPVIAGGGPLSACVPACPENVLQVVSAPALVEVLGRWETYLALAATVAVLIVYGTRLYNASRPRRRALLAVAFTSLLFMPVFFVFHFSVQILKLDTSTLEAMSWVLVGARVLLPLGFLIALFQADLFAGAARGRLLERLSTRPTPEEWRGAVADALDDSALQLAYWDPVSARYLQEDGAELNQPAIGSDRVSVTIDRGPLPVAAIVVDSALAEDPELVRAAASATRMAVENGKLEGELRDSQMRILAAGHAERRRIERDLHDSAQQRLVALRIHLALASEELEATGQRTVVDELGMEVERTIDEVRSIASGVYPDVLIHSGVGPALRSASRNAAIPISIEDHGLRRHAEPVELTIYFCCLEALQNAAKHGGPGVTATVRLHQRADRIEFTIEDDGVGFERTSVEPGAGLANIADRLSAAGGTLSIESAVGRGTRVRGVLPG